MKYWLLILLPAFLFCSINSNAAYTAHKKAQTEYSFIAGLMQNEAGIYNSDNMQSFSSSSALAEMPRGRGNARQAGKSFVFGFLSIFPVLGLIFAPFAYVWGFKNSGRKKKRRGFAIAGIVLATIGIIFTILVLTA